MAGDDKKEATALDADALKALITPLLNELIPPMVAAAFAEHLKANPLARDAEAVKIELMPVLNDVLPDLVADLVDPERAERAAAAEADEAAAKSAREAEKKAAKAARIKAEKDAAARAEKQSTARDTHEKIFADGPPVTHPAKLPALTDHESALLVFSNGETFNIDFTADVTGKLVSSEQGLTVSDDIVPPGDGQAFTASMAVLVIDGTPIAVSVLGAGLQMGGGQQCKMPANSLMFRGGVRDEPADADEDAEAAVSA